MHAILQKIYYPAATTPVSHVAQHAMSVVTENDVHGCCKTFLKPALSARAAKIEIMQNGRYSNHARAYWDNVFFMATELTEAPGRQASYVLPASPMRVRQRKPGSKVVT